jgi:hypothetical protein
MEDPIQFDVWATVNAGCIALAVEALGHLRPELSSLDLRKLINRSVTTNAQILIAPDLRWSEVQNLRRTLLTWANNLSVFQQDYTPEDAATSNYCRIHNLVYGGCLGCHVCSGFYVP